MTAWSIREMVEATDNDRALIEAAMATWSSYGGAALAPDATVVPPLGLAQMLLDVGVTEVWRGIEAEILGGGAGDASLGMMVVRPRERLVYSIKPSNFLRDPVLSAGSASLSAFGIHYAREALPNMPASFPGFLIGLAFTVLRSFAHPVGYGEAALLHHMNVIQDAFGLVGSEALVDAGDVLALRYAYAKGRNSNEVASLLQSLVSWRSLEVQADGAYRVRESVPFGLGPARYVD